MFLIAGFLEVISGTTGHPEGIDDTVGLFKGKSF